MLALALLAGCAPASVQEPEDGKLHIVATVFPAYDFARAAAGDLADVELLLPPGTESHSYEPTPADILKVQSCDLFLYLGGDSDQWVETILEAAEPTGRTLALIDCVETLEEEHVEGMQEEVGHHHDEDEDDHDHDHLGTVTEIDEHVWTAPANAAAITRQFGEVLSVSFLRLFAAFVFLQYLFFVLPVVPPMSALFSLPLSALLFFLLPAHFLSHFPPSGTRTLLPGGSFSAAVSMFPVMPRKAESAPPASVPHTRPSARQLRKATILFRSLLRRQIPLLLSEPAPGSKKEETGRCRR